MNLKDIQNRIEILEDSNGLTLVEGRYIKLHHLKLIRELTRYKRGHDGQYSNLADLPESDQLQIKYFASLENPTSGLDQMAQTVCKEFLKKSQSQLGA